MDPVSIGIAAAALMASKFGESFAKEAGASAWNAVKRLRDVIGLRFGHDAEFVSATMNAQEIDAFERQSVLAARITALAREEPAFAKELEHFITAARQSRAVEMMVAETLDARHFHVAGNYTGTMNLTMHQAVSRPRVISTLRRDLGTFVGRDDELLGVVDALSNNRGVAVCAIHGMAGIGKTALATRISHRLADQFPDGRFFVELHAHTPGQIPADPADVLARLLVGLGVEPGVIPDSADGRRDLWRDRLVGKRVLLVLDDARDQAQVDPLLPATDRCLTLVTSRRRLVALDDAFPVSLETLAPEPAAELFLRLSHRAESADAAAATRIVKLCGYLPLAIVVLAGRLAHHDTWSVSWLADEFAAATDRLVELDVDDRAVRAAFTMSYENISTERQLVFRRIGLHPGSDIDAASVAALAGVSVGQANRILDTLYTDHLIDEIAPRRYRMHDLLKVYAQTLAVTDSAVDVDQAQERLLRYYLRCARAADRHLVRFTRPELVATSIDHTSGEPAIPDIANEAQALRWARAERHNLLACINHAARERPRWAVDLTSALSSLMERDGPWSQGRDLHHQALTITRQMGDQLGEANCLYDLARLHEKTGDNLEAISRNEQALLTFQRIGNRQGEANALNELGRLRRWTGPYGQGIDLCRRALEICVEIGDHHGHANAVHYLGSLRSDAGDYTQAIELHQQALDMYGHIGNRLAEASALTNLGCARLGIGDIRGASVLHRQSLDTAREIGNRQAEALALWHLGDVMRHTGHDDDAEDFFQQSLTAYEEIGHRGGIAGTRAELGKIRCRIGQHHEAASLYQQALDIYNEMGSAIARVHLLNDIGNLSIQTNQPRHALAVFDSALQLAEKLDQRPAAHKAKQGIAHCQAMLGGLSNERLNG